MMFVSFNSNTTGVTSGTVTANSSEIPPVLSGVRVAQSLVFSVVFYRSFFFKSFWPLHCLYFFDLRLLITTNPITYDFTFHAHILRCHWDFFIFYFMPNAKSYLVCPFCFSTFRPATSAGEIRYFQRLT